MKRLLCLLTLLTLLTPACARDQQMKLRCELSVPQTLQAAQSAALTFSLTNVGGEAIQFLTWQTPFEGVKAPMFTIKRDGVEVEYRGRMLKRAAPRKEQYLMLQAGERRESTINLADGWDVDAPGRYTVEYSAELFDVIEGTGSAPRGLEELRAIALSCNSVSFTRTR